MQPAGCFMIAANQLHVLDPTGSMLQSGPLVSIIEEV